MGKVNILVQADSRGAVRGLARVGTQLNTLDRQGTRSSNRLGKALGVGLRGGAVLAGGALLGLGFTAKRGWSELQDMQKASAQTRAVLKSTGNQAGVTAKHVDDLARSISEYSGQDDEAIQAGENLLLTFRDVRNEVGKGNDIFDQATKVVADLSVAMGMDNTKAALQVGKALNDPIRGYTRLQRIGVAFSDAQVKLIKRFDETGQKAKAQGVILKELRAEFGGSAKAYGKTLPGALARANEAFNNAAGRLMGRLLPAITLVVDGLTDFVNLVSKLADAKSIDVAFNIVYRAGGRIVNSIQEALFGGSRSVTKDMKGRTLDVDVDTKGIVGRLEDALAKADMGKVGASISTALVSALQFSGGAGEDIISALAQSLVDHSDVLAEAGATLAAKTVATLLDPSFWAEHWDTALAIAISVFPVTKVLGIGGRLGLFLGKGLGAGLLRIGRSLFGQLFERLLPEAAKGAFAGLYLLGRFAFRRIMGAARTYFGQLFGQLVPKLAAAAWGLVRRGALEMWSAIRSNAASVWGSIKKRISDLLGPIGRILGKIGLWKGAIDTAVSGVQNLIEKVQSLIEWIRNIDWPSPPGWLTDNVITRNIPGNPFSATGGRVAAGEPRIVGEVRPEVFIPDSAGRIAPRLAGSTAGGATVNLHLTVVQERDARRDAHRGLDRLLDEAGFRR